MKNYKRTKISSLHVQGYRSLKDVSLDNLDDLIILHGPNGAGKSNILKSIQLAIRWLSYDQELPMKREDAWKFRYEQADSELNLRLEDFSMGLTPEIRIKFEMELGTRANNIIGTGDIQISRLCVETIAQDVGDGGIIVWFERADIDDIQLVLPAEKQNKQTRQALKQTRIAALQTEASITQIDQQIARTKDSNSILSLEADRRSHLLKLQNLNQSISKYESKLSKEELLVERTRNVFLAKYAIHLCDAYRQVLGSMFKDEALQKTHAMDFVPSSYDIQRALFEALTSEDRQKRMSVEALGSVLSSAGMLKIHSLQDDHGVVRLWPIRNSKYGEYQLLVEIPPHGALPLRVLGTGEQQVVLMMAENFLSGCPILEIEEPEAHLHRKMMEPLAKYFLNIVEKNDGPDSIDQLWLATHHHLFTLGKKYIDVSLDSNGWTKVEEKPREKAAPHFYEPGPFWDALVSLMKSGMRDDSVLFKDETGRPVHASEVKASIDGDRTLANKFVEAATEAAVLSFRRKSEKKS